MAAASARPTASPSSPESARLGYAAPGCPSFNYLDELPYFCAEVLPRLARLGVCAVN
jgi:hypothetical protein